MRTTFCLNDNAKVVLYGFNNISRKIAKNLVELGCELDGIIDLKFDDQRCIYVVDNISTRGIPLADIGEYSADVAIICLNNGMNHRGVAHKLYYAGYNKIIYLPMDDITPQNDASLIRRAYSRVINNSINKTDKLPCYCEKESGIISEEENRISFWCPIELVRTFTYNMLDDMERHLKDRRENLSRYCNIPICKYTPYVDLFRFLSGDIDVSIQEYLSLHRSSGSDRALLINDRKLLFEIYENKLKYDMGFFTDSPIEVVYDRNEKCLHVVDGLHRAIYLISKGYTRIPVIVIKNDYYSLKEGIATP